MIGARGVVIASAGGVRKCVVCIVNLLEYFGAGRAFGGIRGDAVRVRFEGLSEQSIVSGVAYGKETVSANFL